MGMGDIKGDGEAKSGSGFIQIAGIVETHKRPESMFAVLRRNAGTIVIDIEPQALVLDFPRHPHFQTITRRIADEIGQQAAKGVGFEFDRD